MNVADGPHAHLMIEKPLSHQLLDDSEFCRSDGKAGFEPCIEDLLSFGVLSREIPSNFRDCCPRTCDAAASGKTAAERKKAETINRTSQ